MHKERIECAISIDLEPVGVRLHAPRARHIYVRDKADSDIEISAMNRDTLSTLPRNVVWSITENFQLKLCVLQGTKVVFALTLHRFAICPASGEQS